MLRDFNDLQFFIAVVQNRGFSSGARALGVPKSRVSRRVALFEERLGVRLLDCGARGVSLTEIGRQVFDHARAALVEAEAAEEAALRMQSEPRGLVRISCPLGLQSAIAAPLPAFLAAHPRLRVHCFVTNRRVDLVHEGIDVAIRVRERLDTDGDLQMKRIGVSSRILVASPAFLNGGSYFTTRQALDFACISPRNGPDCSHVKWQNALDFTEIMRYHAAMYVETVPNRGSPPAILLRESYREGKSVRKRTLLNLSNWSAEHIEGLRGVLKGGIVVPAGREAFAVQRSLPHGHVAAALGTARAIGLDCLLGPKNGREPNRPRDLVMAMIVSRIIAPASKLATAKALDPATAASSLGVELALGEVGEDELYAALDWLHERQGAIETALAKRHLKGG